MTYFGSGPMGKWHKPSKPKGSGTARFEHSGRGRERRRWRGAARSVAAARADNAEGLSSRAH